MKALPTLPNRQLVSFVIPAMNQQDALEPLFKGIRHSMRASGYDWEIIFIDDGSTDSTWSVMQELSYRDARHITSYKLPAHQGKDDALALGFEVAGGDIIFTMDAGLQAGPEDIPRFLSAIEQGSDIAIGWKSECGDSNHRAWFTTVCTAVLNLMTSATLHGHAFGYKACTKEVIKSLPMCDNHQVASAIASQQGFRITDVEVSHQTLGSGVVLGGVERSVIGACKVIASIARQRHVSRNDHSRHFTVEETVNGFLDHPFILVTMQPTSPSNILEAA
ncbi:glycosyltransferase [Rubritalea marina]|uniref:glycosyltransferase n=1 Tax=Rubritalea marina TaxID=361055 RepID=UPI000372424B|nr:glycosyltransferase [Rubritalea marina]